MKSRAMTIVLARRADDLRARGEALIREADDLTCQSWDEKMWSDGSPIDPSPTIVQTLNGGHHGSRWNARGATLDGTST